MFKGLGAAVAVAGALFASQASATITFDFVGTGTWTGAHFTATLDAVPTTNGFPVTPSDCFFASGPGGPSGPCTLVLYPDTSVLGRPGFPRDDLEDAVGWVLPEQPDAGIALMYFGNNVFSQVGTFASQFGMGKGFLTITDTSRPPIVGAVPEPATWAMMLVGFFGLGSTLRARQRHAERLLAA